MAITETRNEVILELTINQNTDVGRAVKLCLQLVGLIEEECGEITWGIFGDRIIVAHAVTHLGFDFDNLPMN
jgi:hypothetical protein